jgi:hypothetical protein
MWHAIIALNSRAVKIYSRFCIAKIYARVKKLTKMVTGNKLVTKKPLHYGRACS